MKLKKFKVLKLESRKHKKDGSSEPSFSFYSAIFVMHVDECEKYEQKTK